MGIALFGIVEYLLKVDARRLDNLQCVLMPLILPVKKQILNHRIRCGRSLRLRCCI